MKEKIFYAYGNNEEPNEYLEHETDTTSKKSLEEDHKQKVREEAEFVEAIRRRIMRFIKEIK